MIKLFFVVNVDWFFLSHRKEIAMSALRNGFDVTIVTKDTGKRNEIESLGLKFIDLPLNRSGVNIFEELKTLGFLYKLYKKEKPDIIHHVGLKTILWGTFAAKISRATGVVNAVSGLGVSFSSDNKSILKKALLAFLKFSHRINNLAVIFQNNDDKSLFLDARVIKESQAFNIKGSGVDLNKFTYTPEPENSKIRVLFTGRMIEEKGILVLIDAANMLRNKHGDNVEFFLCGGLDDNPKAIQRDELEALCDGIYIQWLGYRTDVLQLLKECHIVAFPSYYREGIPKSLIEATAIGRPIVTTNSIGCKETVVNEWNGYLIPIKNSGSLADRLNVLIEDAEMRQKMGENSRALAEEHFSINKVIEKHLMIYKKLIVNTKE